MKRLFALCSALCILLALGGFSLPTSAATGEVTFSASATNVTVGQTVTLTVTYKAASVGAGVAEISYDTNIFEFVSISGNGTTNSGAAGLLKYTFVDTSNKPTYEFTVTFKSVAAGSNTFNLNSYNLVTFDEEDFTVPSKTLSVSATNPTKSGNANLASLKPSKGTLTPKFSASTTEYTISVDYSVTSLTLSATTADKDAKTAISGKNALTVGKNTRTITVTAPNGTTKKYTVVITREPQKATTTGKDNSGSTTTTTAPPAADALEVTVDGVLMTVSDTQPTVDLPTGFKWDHVNLNGVDVPAAKNDVTGMVLLHLTNEVSKEANFYIYYAAAGEFAPFRPLAVNGGSYVLLDMPAGQVAPAGTVASTFPYEGGGVNAFAYEDTGLADYIIVYATSPAGMTGLYVYDRTDGSLQRYYQQPAQELQVDIAPEPEPDDPKSNAFAEFITRHKSVILTVAAFCCGVALLIAAIVFAARLLPGSRRKGKH